MLGDDQLDLQLGEKAENHNAKKYVGGKPSLGNLTFKLSPLVMTTNPNKNFHNCRAC